jgi:peptidyl-prolyl cis-trans isomerase A (cyclophilin A)/peptidyl-prolyl cis-trans isomerase B (cyclophilin B)
MRLTLLSTVLVGALFSAPLFAAPPATTTAPAAAKPAAAAPAAAAAAKPAAPALPTFAPGEHPRVAIHTTMGDIVVELNPDKAPKSVGNFVQYVKDKAYDGTIFHRVIKDFMIQGGGYDANYKPRPTRGAIPNEANNGLSNLRGTIAMARTGDPNSATNQFFINTVDNNRLDFVSAESAQGWGYAVFGKVVEGLDTVDKIRASETGPGGPFPTDAPKTQVVITKVELLP